jgi:phytoene/squalene synthetase
MQDPSQYRRYAEECRRLAQAMPQQYRSTLLEIADAWIKCAEDVERERAKGTDKRTEK